MFGAMSALFSSLARRLLPLRRRKSITSFGFVATRRRPCFFPCGGGCRDVIGDSHCFVVVKRGGTLRRKAAKPGSFCVGERKRGRGGGGKGGDRLLDGDSDDDEACVWRRTILLGRRCQPLEFAEAIHYDCEGQRLWQPRSPPLLMSTVHLHPSELGVGYMDRA